jgi:outer membrane immunogenic protein
MEHVASFATPAARAVERLADWHTGCMSILVSNLSNPRLILIKENQMFRSLSLVAALAACFFFAASAGAEAAPDHDWTGVYLGAHVGYFHGKDDAQLTGVSPASSDVKGDAFNGGGLLGYNHQSGMFVLGLETDAGGIAGYSVPAVPLLSPSGELSWNYHLRGRAGVAFDRLLPFVAVGFALTQYEVDVIPGATTKEMLYGVSIGGGLDFALTDRIILRTEYLYDNYAEQTMSSPSLAPVAQGADSDLSSHTLRFAMSWQF